MTPCFARQSDQHVVSPLALIQLRCVQKKKQKKNIILKTLPLTCFRWERFGPFHNFTR